MVGVDIYADRVYVRSMVAHGAHRPARWGAANTTPGALVTVRISTQHFEDNVYEWAVEVDGLSLTVMAELAFEAPRTVVLLAAHVQGPGRNAIGTAKLLAALRELKAMLDVDELRIEGAPRTTGANPGRTPRAIRV